MNCTLSPDLSIDQAEEIEEHFGLDVYTIEADGGTWICTDGFIYGRGFDREDSIDDCVTKMFLDARQK